MATKKTHHTFPSGLLSDELRLGPALGHQHLGHVAEVITIITIGPDLGGFGEKHAVAEGDDHLSPGPGDPPQFRRDGFRLLQVLPARHDQGAIKTRVVEGQVLIAIEVLHPVAVKPWIGGEFVEI